MVDTSIAAPDLEEVEIQGVSRSAFIMRGALAASAVYGAGAVGPFVGQALAKGGDLDILNFALTLEYLEAEFYTQAVASKVLTGELAKFAGIVKSHEVAHVAFLKGALGKAAVKKPKFDFKGTTTDAKKFAATAQVLEDTGVAAYLGQVGNIKSKKILGAAGSILPIEARHAGWIRQINGVAGAPRAFEGPRSKKQILAAVTGTGFIVG